MHERGYWTEEKGLPHLHDAGMAGALVELFAEKLAGKTVVDFGCGLGDYVKAMRAAGIAADGYDGNPHTAEFTGGVCGVADITQPGTLGRTWQWALCLEVMEHVPAEFETAALDFVDRHSTEGIILSWATPDQGGLGHVNMKTKEYVLGIAAKRGWSVNEEATRKLRDAAKLSWFRRNTLVLEKEKEKSDE